MSNAILQGPHVIVRELFASPIAVCEWPDAERLNAQLRDVILARFKSSPSVVQSGRYAWQSEQDMHKWPEPRIAQFIAMVKAAAANTVARVVPGADQTYLENWRVISCWANVNPPGGHSHSHNHAETGGHLAGFYYVDLGDCNDPSYAGRTIFEDHSGIALPRRLDSSVLAREYALVPKPGRAALFPAAQFHYVEPNRTKGMRITVAFNLAHPEFDVLYYPNMRDPGWWWRNFRGLMLLRTKIPEKLNALALFASYAIDELRRADDVVPLSRRLKSARLRAEVDASAAADAARAVNTPDGRLPEKEQIV